MKVRMRMRVRVRVRIRIRVKVRVRVRVRVMPGNQFSISSAYLCMVVPRVRVRVT